MRSPNREQMRATEQAREQSGCHQAPSLSHWVGRAGRVGRAGYLYSRAWVWGAGNNANRRVLGAGTGTGLGLARGWAGTDRILAVGSEGPRITTGPTSEWEKVFPSPALPPCTHSGRWCHSFYPGLSLAVAGSCPGFQPCSPPPLPKSQRLAE